MVTKKPKGLGLGLEALLGPKVSDAPAAPAGQPTTLKLDRLQAGKYQPRTRMDEGSLYELAESIKSQGIMQPILVRPLGGPDRTAGDGKSQGPSPATGALSDSTRQYEIIAGERRFRAARLAGLDEVPVLVKQVPDDAAAVMALIENIQREDLNPLEEAQGLKRLVDEFGLTHEQAAQSVGRSRSAASNLLRLLNLAAPVQQMLMAGDLDMGHARALLALDAAQQILSANEIAAKKLSVRDAEKLVAKTQGLSGTGRQTPLLRVKKDKPRDVVRLEEQLADALTAQVEIRIHRQTKRGLQGEVAISFGSLDELNGLLDKLGANVTER
ncbi:ParB/RepB/Spo0J family partition protein [Aquabacterium sp. OR-4]|uniref:ParB/RepB/Spo0J family partition protein n=1 Tax=Aquabacterium sp. OR-4 TaxID=2978127 RepID=UPI0028C5B835|nr:ParB/RepB/Spo0J family partition protein [Aquabacterium sp. OR-4]MDT7833800.1 ParB/RepB/Spo0J family partition protein [Aquabacterium sp. OR-4]